MFELMKIMVEAITKSFSIKSVAELRKAKKLTKIGTDLFVVYTALNSMLVVGRRIVHELETGLAWMEGKVRDGESDRELFTHLNLLLSQQSMNIVRLVRSIKNIRPELELVAPDVYLSLVPLIHGKRNAISILLSQISASGRLPRLVTVSPEWLTRLEEERALTMTGRMRLLNPFDETFLVSEPIENLAAIPAREYQIIRRYLEEHHPRQVLAEIEIAASTLRDAIKDNFSLQDILLNVGDQRAAVDEIFIDF